MWWRMDGERGGARHGPRHAAGKKGPPPLWTWPVQATMSYNVEADWAGGHRHVRPQRR